MKTSKLNSKIETKYVSLKNYNEYMECNHLRWKLVSELKTFNFLKESNEKRSIELNDKHRIQNC